MGAYFQRLARSRVFSWILLFCAYWFVSAATFNGFYSKWGLSESSQRYNIAVMIDGSAHRPFVYRQLLPDIANAFVQITPADSLEKATGLLFYKDALRSKITSPEARDPKYIWQYHIIYYLTFLSILAGCFTGRYALLVMGIEALPAAVAPAVLTLLMPFFQTNIGQFYDYPELMFMAAAVGLALRGPWVAILPLSIVATWNKEAFLFFLMTLFPLLRTRLPTLGAGAITLSAMFLSGVTYLVVRGRFAGNPGGAVELHFGDAARIYSQLGEWFKLEVNYGVLGPKSFGLLPLVVLVGLGLRAWGGLPQAVRQHFILAVAVNLPLFIVLCYPREMRNLSMLYVSLAAFMALAMTPRSDGSSSAA